MVLDFFMVLEPFEKLMKAPHIHHIKQQCAQNFKDFILVWFPLQADPGTKIWIQEVHLWGDLRKLGEGVEKQVGKGEKA